MGLRRLPWRRCRKVVHDLSMREVHTDTGLWPRWEHEPSDMVTFGRAQGLGRTGRLGKTDTRFVCLSEYSMQRREEITLDWLKAANCCSIHSVASPQVCDANAIHVRCGRTGRQNGSLSTI